MADVVSHLHGGSYNRTVVQGIHAITPNHSQQLLSKRFGGSGVWQAQPFSKILQGNLSQRQFDAHFSAKTQRQAEIFFSQRTGMQERLI